MIHWLLMFLESIGNAGICIARKIAGLYDALRGEKSLRMLSLHSDEKESYELHTTHGATITLYCIERKYKLSYGAWWARGRTYRNYRVYGKCEGPVPEILDKLITRGITMGPMLPLIMGRERLKMEAIHTYASYLVSELIAKKEL